MSMEDSKSGSNIQKPLIRYANYFEVGHNAFEFILDLALYYPGNGEPYYHTRIITNPRDMKNLLDTVGEAIEEYKRRYDINLEEET